MTLITTFTFVFLLSLSALTVQGAVTHYDITGPGEIWVLNSSDWRTANISQKVGCLSDTGRFIGTKATPNASVANENGNDTGRERCGVFQKLADYPYTISSRDGNCTFNDPNTEKNVDSAYGKGDHAWSCNPQLFADVSDGLYTIDGFPYPFLCWGDVTCYYDVPRIPSAGKTAPLWQFRWGSQQRDITPGHVMMQLIWNSVGIPKREGKPSPIPGPRARIEDGVLQAPLRGPRVRA